MVSIIAYSYSDLAAWARNTLRTLESLLDELNTIANIASSAVAQMRECWCATFGTCQISFSTLFLAVSSSTNESKYGCAYIELDLPFQFIRPNRNRSHGRFINRICLGSLLSSIAKCCSSNNSIFEDSLVELNGGTVHHYGSLRVTTESIFLLWAGSSTFVDVSKRVLDTDIWRWFREIGWIFHRVTCCSGNQFLDGCEERTAHDSVACWFYGCASYNCKYIMIRNIQHWRIFSPITISSGEQPPALPSAPFPFGTCANEVPVSARMIAPAFFITNRCESQRIKRFKFLKLRTK